MALSQVTHRPSSLKQQNKKHRTLGHRSKGELKAPKGRESVKQLCKKVGKDLNKEQRRHKVKQVRSLKREKTVAKKRSLGTEGNAPFLITVLPLSRNINARKILDYISNGDSSCITSKSPSGITHISCPRFKQRFSFVVPQFDDLYAVLDAVKVSDTLLLVWEPDEPLGEVEELLISAILAQGLPSIVHSVLSFNQFAEKNDIGLDQLEKQMTSLLSDQENKINQQNKEISHCSTHKKIHARQRLMKEVESKFTGPVKIYSLDQHQDSLLLLRQIGAQKQRPIFHRDNRPHLIAESVSFEGEETTGVMKITGYLRGKTLSANDIIHIPGLKDFQLKQIDTLTDPHPINVRKNSDYADDVPCVFETADPSIQESLDATNELDPMDGEQTWPTPEELLEAEARQKEASKPKMKRVPKGTSEYQAAWILDDEDGEDNGDDDDELSDIEEEPGMVFDPVECKSQIGDLEDLEEDNEEYETMTMTEIDENDYDNNLNMESEMDALAKFRAARDDARFPDEIDTPNDVPARIRFQKYRGLESFRTSEWDPMENLPYDYGKIFQFHNFTHTRKRIFKNYDEKFGALAGWYVVLHVADVPRYMYDSIKDGSGATPVVFGVLPYEQKMSVINCVIKSHNIGHHRAIASKEKLVYHVGFGGFADCAIFSEHSTGNKHKCARFFHPGDTVVATMFAPITFPPTSVLVFKQYPDGVQTLVATGSLLSVDPNRIVCKRTILSGHPLKVNKKSAVIRYMFFNRQDVEWFKPVELKTKWGRRGNIKEPLGTHGHMKCFFDGPLKSQDTILMNLYKRMFPKWHYDPFVMKPPSLYTNQPTKISSNDDEDESLPKSKKRKVHFASR